MFDVLVVIRPDGTIDSFNRAILRACDPDWILNIDPRLDRVQFANLLPGLDLQPFGAFRFREGAERAELARFFSEGPTSTNLTQREEAVDYDRPTLTWRDAAVHGLLQTQSRRRRVRPPQTNAQSPVVLGREYLRSRVGTGRWVVFGESDDKNLAVVFWSLRALGARPQWVSLDALSADELPMRLAGRRFWLYAPAADSSVVHAAAKRWSLDERTIRPTPDDPTEALGRSVTYFTSQLQPAIEHGGLLRFSLPALPVTPEPLRRVVSGVAEHHLLSADPESPDGTVLSRSERARQLVIPPGQVDRLVRITHRGIAEVQNIARPTLIVLREVNYRDAVAAPLEDAGYSVSTSDKGRYQQRSLELAKGLRFLAWCFRQGDSARLLDLFYEHHLGQPSGSEYRRAVTLDDLRTRLLSRLRERRTRVRGPLRVQAEAWLIRWTDALLERGLLTAGNVLACPRCAYREWYRSDEVGQRFTCKRCSAQSHVPADVERSFRMNEAFWQLRHHNGQVITLLLSVLRDEASMSLLYLPEVFLTGEATRDGEADVAALVDGSLILAEAKSNNELTGTEVNWYRTVAARARAKRLVFATIDRSRQLCSTLDCATCRTSYGRYHRDYAWSDGARARVEDTRNRLRDRGVEVTTACYQSLVAAYPEANEELQMFPGFPD